MQSENKQGIPLGSIAFIVPMAKILKMVE